MGAKDPILEDASRLVLAKHKHMLTGAVIFPAIGQFIHNGKCLQTKRDPERSSSEFDYILWRHNHCLGIRIVIEDHGKESFEYLLKIILWTRM